jgi:hypothetical protein
MRSTCSSPRSPQLYQYQRQRRGRSVDDITEALAGLARAILAQDPTGRHTDG